MLRLILQENTFQFNGKDFLQTHGTAMGTKTAVSFANIFMAKIETAIIDQHSTRLLLSKRYIDDVFPYGTLIERKLTHSLLEILPKNMFWSQSSGFLVTVVL